MSVPQFIQPLGMARNPQAAALLIDRTFNEGEIDQYKRELVVNAFQSGATLVRATAIRIEDYGKTGGIKAAFVDNGRGMSSDKITDYIGELFNGASTLGADGNFQMGARVSTLPFNRDGLLVASWTEDEPDGSMIEVCYDDESQCYQIVGQEEADGSISGVGIPDDYLKHPIIAQAGHGTVVILLGGDQKDHTLGKITRNQAGEFVYPTTYNKREEWLYYNSKFWTLPDGVKFHILWGNEQLSGYIAGGMKPGDWYEDAFPGSGELRLIQGTKDIIENNSKSTDYPCEHGQVHVTSKRGYGATVHWALFHKGPKFTRGEGGGGASDAYDYGIPLGMFGEMHKNEVYHIHYSVGRKFISGNGSAQGLMEWYGIGMPEVRGRLVLVVEPDKANQKFIGAVPSGSRRHLMIANSPLPHAEWGEAFLSNMPAPIAERIHELAAETPQDATDLAKKVSEDVNNFFTRISNAAKGNPNPVGPEEPGDGESGDDDDDGDKPGGGKGKGKGTDEPTPGGRRGGVTPRKRTRSRIGGGKSKRKNAPSSTVPNVGTPPELKWDENGAQFEDEGMQGLLVHLEQNATKKTLHFNGASPYMRSLIETAQKSRSSGRAPLVKRMVIDAIMEHMCAHFMSAERYPRSTLATTVGGVPTSVRTAVMDDWMLSFVLLNGPTTQAMVNKAFQGRRGFAMTSEEATV